MHHRCDQKGKLCFHFCPIETIEGRKTTTLDKHCHCAHRALIAQDIMVDPITMAEVLSKPNSHAWPMYPLKLNLQVLIETKHKSL